jgi:DNA-binding response OmpR family regulator
MNGGGADRRAGTGSSDGGGADGGAGASAADGGATGFYSAAGRSQTAPGEKCCGPFRLSAAERRLWKVDEEIVLTPTEWTLVKLLMERAGEGLSRDEILNAVWGRHFIGDLKIVDVNIRRIRQKIEDEPSDPRYIETLWGYGYRWNRSDKR